MLTTLNAGRCRCHDVVLFRCLRRWASTSRTLSSNAWLSWWTKTRTIRWITRNSLRTSPASSAQLHTTFAADRNCHVHLQLTILAVDRDQIGLFQILCTRWDLYDLKLQHVLSPVLPLYTKVKILIYCLYFYEGYMYTLYLWRIFDVNLDYFMCKFMLTSLTELITHSCTCCSSSSYMIMQLCMCALSTLYCCALGALHCCVCVHNVCCNVATVPTI